MPFLIHWERHFFWV